MGHGRRRLGPGASPWAQAVALDWGIFCQHFRGAFIQPLQLECDIAVPHQFEPCDKGAGESDLKPARPIGNGWCEGRQAPLQRQVRGLLLKQRCDTQHGIGDAPEVRLRRTVSRWWFHSLLFPAFQYGKRRLQQGHVELCLWPRRGRPTLSSREHRLPEL